MCRLAPKNFFFFNYPSISLYLFDPANLLCAGDVQEAAQLLNSKEVRVNCLDEVRIINSPL